MGKQVFFRCLRDRIYDFLSGQAHLTRPHRARLLIQAAEDLIDPRIEAALTDCRAEDNAVLMMMVLGDFVRNNGYLLSERQTKACSLIVNSPTIGEGARDGAIALLQENASTALAAAPKGCPDGHAPKGPNGSLSLIFLYFAVCVVLVSV